MITDISKSLPAACALTALLSLPAGVSAAEAVDGITRHPLPGGSTFPIANAVETDGSVTIVYHSGTVPAPADPEAALNSRDYWGDTETQTRSVLSRLQNSLALKGLSLGDVIKMTVFLVGDPALEGKMDFSGFMAAYTQFFGTQAQPNLPARSAVQVAGLVAPGMMVEIEVIAARP